MFIHITLHTYTLVHTATLITGPTQENIARHSKSYLNVHKTLLNILFYFDKYTFVQT